MSDVAAAIMDAAERRMRKGGFSGFSFREIAAAWRQGVLASTIISRQENPRGCRHPALYPHRRRI